MLSKEDNNFIKSSGTYSLEMLNRMIGSVQPSNFIEETYKKHIFKKVRQMNHEEFKKIRGVKEGEG